ncbi:MAG: polysaccharide biosynthesis protein [Oscillospiraceae bacterium]|nr:polysaccharide biosynthesis protein [Oscillospiraceae bacterium]
MRKNTAPSSKKNLFFSGVLILTLSNLLIKVIGAMYKIPLTNIIGDEGMGYFSVANRIYVWFYMLSTAGLPIALAKMISESRTKNNIREIKKIYNIALKSFLIIGFTGMAVMILGSRLFGIAMKSEATYMCIIAIAPTLFFVCVSSAMRGFFQGYQNMFPTAISQILEAAGKLILGILFTLYAMDQGYELPLVAAFAIAGLTIGAAAGMLFLMIVKFFHKDEIIQDESLPVRDNKSLLITLVKLAVPITISASIMSLTDLIDVFLILRRLQDIGFTEATAQAINGNYTQYAVTLLNFPPILIYPISYSIMPLIAGALAANDKLKAITASKTAIKVAAIIAIPCALGMSVLSKPILNIFFVRDASVDMAAPLLSILAPSVFFIGMLSVTNAILQANGFVRKPIISMLCGAAGKLIISTTLIGIPAVGIYGAPIGTFVCYLIITAMNLYFLSKYVGITPGIIKIFFRPLIAAVACALAAIGANLFFTMIIPGRIATLGSIAVAGLIYVIILFLIKGITQDDILMMPKGTKILKILQKIKLM